MRKNKMKLIAYGLFIAMTLSSCGKNSKLEAPELLEPKVTNESYRPVERTDVGTIKMGANNGNLFLAKVVAKQESYFWTSSARIENIAVNVGDYVEAGQVLATADLEDAMDVLVDKRYQGLKMEQVSDMVGFSNRQSFYASFYKIMKMTPREYRIKHLTQNSQDAKKKSFAAKEL